MTDKILFPTKYGHISVATNNDISGKIARKEIRSLVKISTLHTEISKRTSREYYSPLLEKLLKRKITFCIRSANLLRQLGKTGYLYFTKKNQLLVLPGSFPRNDYLVVRFIDESRAKCNNIWGTHVIAENVLRWTTEKDLTLPKTNFSYPSVTKEQADLVVDAIHKFNLPYEKVGEAIQLISNYILDSKQNELFEKLENGFSQQEYSNTVTKINEKQVTIERYIRYRKAAKFETPLFLEDKKQLLMPNLSYLFDLSDTNAKIYYIGHAPPSEIGRYVLKRKWGKNVKIKKTESKEFINNIFDTNEILEQIEKTVQKIPELYQMRLKTLYDKLLAYALKK